GGGQRLTGHRQRRAVWRMGVHDGIHVGSMTVNPKVKAVRRIYHPVAGEQVEIVVDQYEIAGTRLVEAEAKAQHPIGAGPLAARCDLAGECGLVAFGGENATGKRYLLTERPGGHG